MKSHFVKCKACGGTGRLRIEWWVLWRYQDGTDRHGPYATEDEASKQAAHFNKERRGGIAQVYTELYKEDKQDNSEAELLRKDAEIASLKHRLEEFKKMTELIGESLRLLQERADKEDAEHDREGRPVTRHS